MTVHVGILGAGGISDTHARAAAAIPGVVVSAVCGENREKARRLADQHGAAVLDDLESFLAHRPLDLVAIGSPSGRHVEQGLACARAGRDILMEKPLGIGTAEVDSLIAACDAAGVGLGVFFQDRLQPDFVRLKAFLDEGGLGRVHLVTAHVKWYRPPEYYAGSRWRGVRSLDGGGAVMNQGIHTVDLLLWLLGDVQRIDARTRTAVHKIEVEDTAVALLEFGNGALGTFEAATSASPGYPRRVEISGESGTLVIEHDRVVAAHLKPGAQPFAVSAPVASAESAASHVVSDATPHRRIFEDFLASRAAGRRPVCDAREGRRSVALVEALYASASSGQPVDLSTMG